MSIMMALAASGGGTLVTKTYTFSQTVTIPAGVSNLALVSGQGAPGSPADSYYQQVYTEQPVYYYSRTDLGGGVTVSRGPISYRGGPTPANYCDPMVVNGNASTQTCYEFVDKSSYQSTPATTGAAASGFGKTFPGGTGGPATPQSFKDVAVTPGQQFSITVPSGGSITISYYA